MTQETTTVPETVEIVETPEVNHDLHCTCESCENDTQSKFSPFYMEKWSKKGIVYKPCPRCSRPVMAKARKGFLIWNCWECTSKRATVTSVYDKNDRNFGFASRDNDGAVVYFHLSRQRLIVCHGGEYLHLEESTEELPPPEVGDRILYHEMPGEKTLKALWWAFEKKYNSELLELEDRPLVRFVWREGRIPVSRLQEKPKYRSIWEGKNLEELRLRFNPEQYPVFEKGHMAKYFEVYNPETDEWDVIDDPR